MNKILICHLSDIHFSSPITHNTILERVAEIGQAIYSKCLGITHQCIILVSGDISFAGKAEDYSTAEIFFNNLKSVLNNEGIDPFYIFVPGNHDCLINDEDSIRPLVIQNICNEDSGKVKSDQINICLSVQQNYTAFIKQFNMNSFEQKLNILHEVNINNREILFNLINTAWLSLKKQDPNSISMPISILSPIDAIENYDVIISVFHHPYCWLKENDYFVPVVPPIRSWIPLIDDNDTFGGLPPPNPWNTSKK